MERALEDRVQEQVEARAEVAEAKAGEVVLRQDQVGIASVQAVVKEQPIK
jgi:hypothetical protein